MSIVGRLFRLAPQLTDLLDFGAEPALSKSLQVQKSNTALPAGTQVVLTTQVQPTPNATQSLGGTEAGDGQMNLYQSGANDKVLLIAELDHRARGNEAKKTRAPVLEAAEGTAGKILFSNWQANRAFNSVFAADLVA